MHKMCVTAAVRLFEAGGGPACIAVRVFSALPDGLRAMTDWLRGRGCKRMRLSLLLGLYP